MAQIYKRTKQMLRYEYSQHEVCVEDENPQLMCELLAEEHADRCFTQWYKIPNGAAFCTSNGTLVQYVVI